MPIVATAPDKKPNDDFVNQLILNANAAIDKLVSMGVSDRNKMAVGICLKQVLHAAVLITEP